MYSKVIYQITTTPLKNLWFMPETHKLAIKVDK